MSQLHLIKPQTSSERVLEALKQAGKYGLLNHELANPRIGALSWHRRIGDLRADGHNIGTQRISQGVFRYYLIPEKVGRDE